MILDSSSQCNSGGGNLCEVHTSENSLKRANREDALENPLSLMPASLSTSGAIC